MRVMQQLVAQLHEQITWLHNDIDRHEAEIAERDARALERIREVEDWARASSLDQLRGMHPTAAMEANTPLPPRRLFRHDPTGMIIEEVDPNDFDPYQPTA